MRKIKIVADSSANLMSTDKCRGETKAVSTIFKHLKENGLKTGKVQIAHCNNENAANALKAMIQAELPQVTVSIGKNLGLCSYYAERGGLLVGYEKF